MEVTPGKIYAKYEHHVTGAIAFALQQYIYATKDRNLFNDLRYKKLMVGVAQFWESRLVYDKTKQRYTISSKINICDNNLAKAT